MEGRAPQHKRLITSEGMRRNKYKKQELSYLVLKSILSNKNQSLPRKQMLLSLKNKKSGESSISRQVSRCLYTGKARSYQKLFSMSRHRLKAAAISGQVQNLRVRSW